MPGAPPSNKYVCAQHDSKHERWSKKHAEPRELKEGAPYLELSNWLGFFFFKLGLTEQNKASDVFPVLVRTLCHPLKPRLPKSLPCADEVVANASGLKRVKVRFTPTGPNQYPAKTIDLNGCSV